jgi:putative transposase
MIRLWRNAWAEFIPFLDYDVEIRTQRITAWDIVLPSTAESAVNAYWRHADPPVRIAASR